MAVIGENERRHLNALFERSRDRKPSRGGSSLSSSSSRETSETRRRTQKLRKQSSPAYLPSITVTRHSSFAPTSTTHKAYDEDNYQHNRAKSVRAVPGHQSRRISSARLSVTELPAEFRPRSNTNPRAQDGEEQLQSGQASDSHGQGEDEQVYRRRNFNVSPKGVVTNRGDCYRPRSNSSSINQVGLQQSPVEYVPTIKGRLLSVSSAHSGGGGGGPERRLSLGGQSWNGGGGSSVSTTTEDESSETPNTQYRVLICGGEDVGKTALINQFLSSEQTNVYEYNKTDGERLEKTVSILLDGKESDLNFIDVASLDYVDNLSEVPPADAYLLVYNVTDRTSFESVIDNLYDLKQSPETRDRAIILVGNKSDLVRARIVTTEEGKSIAASYDCKFVETSAALCDHVDELLVGVLTQIRLKEAQGPAKKQKHRKVFKYKKHGKDKNKLTHTYEKAMDLLTKLVSKNNSKSCGNLYVL
ncbi:putative GTP-binding protein GEM [Hypsibius exemplaris]|uniref:GTP-binding protein GEM n=1 Tax=Hypsibius exemplaris TaxID=2072580 RepID=A0A1W0W8J6_HYPEX|nr:putative GTP-binding protein GEM [Hypsibius exemplaris]